MGVLTISLSRDNNRLQRSHARCLLVSRESSTSAPASCFPLVALCFPCQPHPPLPTTGVLLASLLHLSSALFPPTRTPTA